MAGANLFALIDDIATLLDDVALLAKVAAKKTAGVLGDDLALNAQQVAGVSAERELPVVWAVFKGSAVNKLILVPAAMAISAFIPWAVVPLLMVGGAFLCFEGFEKLAHKFLHKKHEDDAHHSELAAAVADPTLDLVAFERDKIKGAVRTDFILSAEIVAITLGTVTDKPLGIQFAVLAGVAAAMTVGVYGCVAGIVKLDDLGLYLTKKASSAAQAIGRALLATAPYLMKALSVAGTAAMFLVGGGILVHGIGPLHHSITDAVAGYGGFLGGLAEAFANAVVGIIAGAVVLAGVTVVGKLFKRSPKAGTAA